MAWDLFNKVYLINLDSSTERLAVMTARLNKLGIEFERWPGVIKTDNGSYQNPGAHGCAAAHLSLWRHIIKHDKYALILEDDVVFRDDIADRLKPMKNDITSALDQGAFVYLGGSLTKKSETYRVNKSLVRVRSFGTFAYSVGSAKLKLNLDRIEKSNRRKSAIDIRILNWITQYHVVPPLIAHECSVSTISGNTQPGGRVIGFKDIFNFDDFVNNCSDRACLWDH